jgi:hypothetical protein
MLLLKHLGATVEEQIAGLIHDVPHTAFSHVIDYIFGGNDLNSSYHEIIQKQIFEESEIPDILDKYSLDKDKIFDIHNFSILERNLPDLCADRVDYILRDLLTYDLFTNEEVNKIIRHLVVHENEIVLNDIDTAFLIATKAIEANVKIWSSPYQILIARKLADALKISLQKNHITFKDIHGTDNSLFRKLKNVDDIEVQKNLDCLTQKIVVTLNEENFSMHVKTKLRVIDPKILIENSLTRLSEVSDKFSELKNVYVKKHKEGFYLNVRERAEGEEILN